MENDYNKIFKSPDGGTIKFCSLIDYSKIMLYYALNITLISNNSTSANSALYSIK